MKAIYGTIARGMIAACGLAGLGTGAGLSAATNHEGAEEAAIRQVLVHGCESFAAKDKSGATGPFLNDPQFMVFDFTPPQRKNYAEHKAETDAFPAMMQGPVTCEYLEIHPYLLGPDAAYSWSLMRFATGLKDGRHIDVTFRSTDIWRKAGGAWKIVHEHNSFPVDIFTGKAVLDSFTGKDAAKAP